ncbi:hypothetical protein CDAR_84671 [Caerostris darwini]|uniref:DUF5641 domain-containing protein n=1 Tax=Caerostris darwini TaxID=1538125 RepID=A0AAV4UYT2_9ARAC|nr:hypothetical protein CDAR_84671 [Caerostris darwini]
MYSDNGTNLGQKRFETIRNRLRKLKVNLESKKFVGNLKYPFTGRVLEKYPGKDGIIRLAKLRTEKGNILRPIQRLYPMELTPNYEQVVPETQKVPKVVTEYPELSTDSNETVPVSRSGREIKPVKRHGFINF